MINKTIIYSGEKIKALAYNVTETRVACKRIDEKGNIFGKPIFMDIEDFIGGLE